MQRKTIFLFGLTLLIIALLSACGGQAAPATSEAAPIQAAVQPTSIHRQNPRLRQRPPQRPQMPL